MRTNMTSSLTRMGNSVQSQSQITDRSLSSEDYNSVTSATNVPDLEANVSLSDAI